MAFFLSTMIPLLSQPYPHNALFSRYWLLVSAGAGGFIALFLIVFQPFGASYWQHPNKNLILAGYGLVTFLCLSGISFAMPLLFKRWYSEANWTVGKEILGVLLILVIISVGNWLYSQWFFVSSFRIKELFGWIGITVAIGIIPTTIITLLDYTRLQRKYATDKLSVKTNTEEQPAPASLEIITLIAENLKDTFSLSPDELLFIESASNYSEVVFLKENNLQKMLIRSSLSRLEEQIQHSDIVRCHRSFIINLKQVSKITGNAQGYKLQLKNVGYPLPVARRYTDLIATYYQK